MDVIRPWLQICLSLFVLTLSEVSYGSCLRNPFFVRFESQVRTYDRIISDSSAREIALHRRLAPLEDQLNIIKSNHELLKCSLEEINVARELMVGVYGHLNRLIQTKSTLSAIREEINAVRGQLVAAGPEETKEVLQNLLRQLRPTDTEVSESLTSNINALVDDQQRLHNLLETIGDQLLILASSSSLAHLVAQMESARSLISNSRISEERIRQQISVNERQISHLYQQCTPLRTQLNQAKETKEKTIRDRAEYIRANQRAADESRFCAFDIDELRRPR